MQHLPRHQGRPCDHADRRGQAALTDIVAAARAEAARLGHDYIGSEHLFLALLGSGDPSLGTILTSFNLDPAVVRERIERRAPKGRGAPLAEGDAALRSGAKRALEASRSDGSLLHALLRDGKGPAALTMQDLGVPVEKVRAALQSVAPPRSPETPSRPAETSSRPARPPRSKEKVPRREDPAQEPPRPATPRLPPVRESLLNWRNVLLVAVPVSMVLYHMNAPSWIVFTAACLAFCRSPASWERPPSTSRTGPDPRWAACSTPPSGMPPS